MHHGLLHNPALTVALALAAGTLAQSLARHLRIPGIVLLLGAGVVLGPDVAGVVEPGILGEGLPILTGFAVAVILFDGGLNLNLRRMRGQAPVINRLLSLGVVVTAGGGALAAHTFLGWGWTPALLFGTLVIVTGPTVVTPLLRRIKVRRNIETILESEGVLIDAVGAVIAVVALEIALGDTLAAGAVNAPSRLLAGLALGAAGGGLMALLLRLPRVVPEGNETITTLALTLALYQVSNALTPESGIMAAIVAGAVVGNVRARSEREIREFKEQLTVLLIGMLFVLLAADVRIADVVALGRQGVLVVLVLMFLVRPLNVLLCTWGTGLTRREKIFLAWVAPRGIVAAAVASLFAERLDTTGGGEVGAQLRALVFLVIAATVVVQGATAGVMARWLGVRRPSDKGFAILGAQPLGRLLARLLMDHGHEVVLLDSNASLARLAQEEGLKVVYGNALDESVLLRSQMDTRRAVIGATNNEAINLLFVRKVREEAKVPRLYAILERGSSAVSAAQLDEAGVQLFGGVETDPEMWSVRIRRGLAEVQPWRRAAAAEEAENALPNEMVPLLLPLFVLDRKDRLEPVTAGTRWQAGTFILWLVLSERTVEAAAWLTAQGWEPAPSDHVEPAADAGEGV